MVTEKQNNDDSNEKETRLNAIRDILSINKDTDEFDLNQWVDNIMKKMKWKELVDADLNDFNHVLKKISNTYLKKIKAGKTIVESLDFDNFNDSTIENLREELQSFVFVDFDFNFNKIFKKVIEANLSDIPLNNISSAILPRLPILPILPTLENTQKITFDNLQILQKSNSGYSFHKCSDDVGAVKVTIIIFSG